MIAKKSFLNSPETQNNSYAIPIPRLSKLLDTNLKYGLSSSEAKKRLGQFGTNEIPEKKRKTILERFFDQFTSFLVIILILAGGVSYFLGEHLDALIIGIIIVANAILGVVQEWRGDQSLKLLKKSLGRKAKALRDGTVIEIDASGVVRGDIIVLTAGDWVPADIRLFEADNVKINESSLTGESLTVSKNNELVKNGATIHDKKNILFMGTYVVNGDCKGIVIATGISTEIGSIAGELSEEKTKTPLEQDLDKFSIKLGYGVLVICLIIFFINIIPAYISGKFSYQLVVDYFIVAVALAVAAIPEGLAAVVTITLALGVERMAKHKAIVRRLPSVETLGCTNIICTDKTGTLTKNEMTVTDLFVDNKVLHISGIGYAVSDGAFSDTSLNLGFLLYIGRYCNTTSLMKKNGIWKVLGDPTEAALLVAANKFDNIKNQNNNSNKPIRDEADFLSMFPKLKIKIVKRYPFDSIRKMMSVLCEFKGSDGKKKYLLLTKGSPESILNNSTKIRLNNKTTKMTPSQKSDIDKINNSFASKGLRNLAFAYRLFDKIPKIHAKKLETNFTFLGITGMLDPPRIGVLNAINEAKKAGIDIVMITGDQKGTAISIAKSLGIFSKQPESESKSNSGFKSKIDEFILDGKDVERLSVSQLSTKMNFVKIIYRASPLHKVKILNALKERNYVVAMTGDGVNDAPVLKKADVGIAMGHSGTEVAKEASDLILQDDNFSTIIRAVEMGRSIYQSIFDFIIYTMSSNVAEIMVILMGTLLGWPLPLTAIQILWMNLVTDGIPGLALGMDKPVRNLLKEKPRQKNKSIINKYFIYYTLAVSSIIGIISLGGFYIFSGNGFSNLPLGRTMALNIIVLMEMANVLNLKTADDKWLPDIKRGAYTITSVIFTILLQFLIINTTLNKFFRLTNLDMGHWLLSLGLVILGYFIIRILSFYLVKFRE